MRKMNRQDTPSAESIEDLLQGDDDDDGFAHDNDSNDDVFGGAFSADDLLNCSLTSGGGLDLSTSNRGGLAGGHMSFSTSQGNLSTDECSFGVFDCDPPPPSSGTLIGVGVAVVNPRNSSNDAEFSTSQLAEESNRGGGRRSFPSGNSSTTSSSHNSNNDSNNNSNRASPSARQSRSPDMTLEMVTRTGALALGSFHASTSNNNISQPLQQRLQQQQHHYNNDDHSHRSHNSYQTTASSQQHPSPGRGRTAPVRAFSSGFIDYGGGSTDNLNLPDEDNNRSSNRFQQQFQQQQQLPPSTVVGESNTNGSNSMLFNNNNNSSSNLSFCSNKNNYSSNSCMQQQSQRSTNSSSHRPSPTRSFSTNTHQFAGSNLDCAPLYDTATSSSGNNNNNGNMNNGMNNSNNMMNGLNTNDNTTLNEMQLRMQQFQEMQRMQKQGNNDNISNMNNFQIQQNGNNNNKVNNNFPMMQNNNMPGQAMQNNNFQMMKNNMPVQAQNNRCNSNTNNNFEMQNHFTQMPNMQQMQMLNDNSFHNNGNTNCNTNTGMPQQQQVHGSCGDTLLGTFPQGNAFSGMQGNVSIVGPSSQRCTPTKPQFPSPSYDAQLSPVAAGLKAAAAPSSMNEVMEKLSESMRRSAMSRSVVKQLSSRNIMARAPHNHQNPVMMMAQKQRGLMQRNTSDRSMTIGGGAGADSSGRSIPVRRMSNSFNSKHHIQHPLNRSVHRHNSQQSLDAQSSHSITFQMDGRNMGTL